MHDIYIKDIIRLCDGKVLCGNEELKLSTFCTDTRKLNDGDVYVGIKGDNFDGSSFYMDAIEKGASVCILNDGYDYNTDLDCTIVLVEDTLKCIQELARYKRSLYDIPVIAVTGSVGKTSTKDIIASVVSKRYNTHKTSGNYNNHLGVPLTILSMGDDTEALVVEMGMNHLGEISLLSKIAKPTISVITNVGTAHIGNLGSRENILKAKLEILDGMVGDIFIYNGDNDMLKGCIDDRYDLEYTINPFTYSIDNESDWKAININEDVFSSKFDILNTAKGINVNVGGRPFIYNSLVAYAIGEVLDIEDRLIREGINEFKLSSSRLEKKVMKNGVVLIDDTYNANYDSMKSSIELLGKVNDKRKIAILGDMLELGDYTEKLHRDLGDVVVNSDIDVLITIGEHSKFIEERVLELGMNKESIYHFDRESDSYAFLDDYLDSNDIVLLKGSHGIHLIGIVDYLMK